jgi:acetolactate synthase-1/2/3 large subunit
LNQEALTTSRTLNLDARRQRSAAYLMLEAFARRGVRAAFGIPGGLISPIYDAVADVPQIAMVHTRHEAMAAFNAMGHALVTGKPALVLTTGGPGLTNAITGIAAAFAEGLPLIAIAGEVPASAASRAAIQDATTNGLDAVAMLRTVTRWSCRVDSPEGAVGAAENAVRIATGPRPGPVFLSVPLDVASAMARGHWLALSEAPPEPSPDADACASAASWLMRASRPLLVVGNGARSAARQVRTLAERLAIPVVTTPHAKGVFPDSHPLSLGGIGLGGDDAAMEYLASGTDVVLVVGSRLGDLATNGWAAPIAGSAATIQIDREPWLIGRNCPVTLGIVGAARESLDLVLGALPDDVRLPSRTYARRVFRTAPYDAAKPLPPARVLAALQTAFPDALWTVDQGEHCAYALHDLRIEEPDQFRSMMGLCSMGSGFGIGIGAAHAGGPRRVVTICGDGGFAMHAGEVLTCVQHGIDLVLVIFNDGRWNMVHHGFKAVFGRRPTELPSVVADIAGVARSFGAESLCVRTLADLDPVRLRKLASQGRPLVVDVRFDAGTAISVGSRSASLSNFKGASR